MKSLTQKAHGDDANEKLEIVIAIVTGIVLRRVMKEIASHRNRRLHRTQRHHLLPLHLALRALLNELSILQTVMTRMKRSVAKNKKY